MAASVGQELLDVPLPDMVLKLALGIAEAHWSGLGSGHGYLDSREVLVNATNRHSGISRTARLMLPDSTGRLSADAGETMAEQTQPRSTLRAVG